MFFESHHLAECRGRGQKGNVPFGRLVEQRRGRSGGYCILCPGIVDGTEISRPSKRARTDSQRWNGLADSPDRFKRYVGTQRHFDKANTGRSQRLGDRHGLIGGRKGHHRYNRMIFKDALDVFFSSTGIVYAKRPVAGHSSRLLVRR